MLQFLCGRNTLSEANVSSSLSVLSVQFKRASLFFADTKAFVPLSVAPLPQLSRNAASHLHCSLSRAVFRTRRLQASNYPTWRVPTTLIFKHTHGSSTRCCRAQTASCGDPSQASTPRAVGQSKEGKFCTYLQHNGVDIETRHRDELSASGSAEQRHFSTTRR